MTHDQHTSARRHRRPARTTALLGLLVGLLGLLVVAAPSPALAADVPAGKSWVRIGHFVPGMGETTIELEPEGGGAGASVGATPMGGATYGEVSDYQGLAPGRYTATVRESSAAADSAPLLSRTFDITAGDARTLAVVGTSDAPRLVLLTDDLTPPAAGTARVRLLSASEAAGTVTVQAVNGPTVAKGAVLGQATPYATVPSGSWTLELQGDMGSVRSQAVPIGSGNVYTVVALDVADGGVELQVVTDAAGATVAPRGGAETGFGGTAPDRADATVPAGTLGGLAALVGVAALGTLTTAGRRRRLVATSRR